MAKHPQLPEEFCPSKEQLDAYRDRVARYTISLSVFKQLWRDRPDLFGEEDWRQAEAVLAEKYGLSDNSIFRQKDLPDFEAEQTTTPVPHKKTRAYTKRNAEYWAKYDKGNDERGLV